MVSDFNKEHPVIFDYLLVLSGLNQIISAKNTTVDKYDNKRC